MRNLLRSKVALWLIGAALLIGGFLKLTSELLEGELQGADSSILRAFARVRSPALTATALDNTALGSPTLIVLFALISVGVCWLRDDRRAALQLSIAALTAPIVSWLVKSRIERARPTEVPRLVEVWGFSYPSGHSVAAAYFYLTLAIVVWTRTQSRFARGAVLSVAVVLGGLVALSRSYLGAHYPSDTLAGVAVGAGLALLVAAAFSATRSLPPDSSRPAR